MLIAENHGDAAAIGRLTQRQILLHYEAALRRRRRERAELLVDVNLAFAGGDSAKAHHRDLVEQP